MHNSEQAKTFSAPVSRSGDATSVADGGTEVSNLNQIVGAQAEIVAIEAQIEDPLIAPMIMNFVNRLPSRIAEIESAINAVDWAVVEMLAHRLAGSQMFGYPMLGDIAHKLEHVAK